MLSTEIIPQVTQDLTPTRESSCCHCLITFIRKYPLQRYCGRSCFMHSINLKKQNRELGAEKICPTCNRSFAPVIGTRRKFCSTKCQRGSPHNLQNMARYTRKYRREHSEKSKNWGRNRRELRRTRGLCISCNMKVDLDSGSLCTKHWFMDRARGNLASSALGPLLGELLERQNNTCPYTGMHLTPEVNCSLDHILPVSRFVDSRTQIENVEWVHSLINTMKGSLTKDEFIAVCRLIVEYTKSHTTHENGPTILADRARHTFKSPKRSI